jgi:hypothetical protein
MLYTIVWRDKDDALQMASFTDVNAANRFGQKVANLSDTIVERRDLSGGVSRISPADKDEPICESCGRNHDNHVKGIVLEHCKRCERGTK